MRRHVQIWWRRSRVFPRCPDTKNRNSSSLRSKEHPLPIPDHQTRAIMKLKVWQQYIYIYETLINNFFFAPCFMKTGRHQKEIWQNTHLKHCQEFSSNTGDLFGIFSPFTASWIHEHAILVKNPAVIFQSQNDSWLTSLKCKRQVKLTTFDKIEMILFKPGLCYKISDW